MSDDTSISAVNDSGEACMRVSENVTSSDPTSIYGVNEDGKAVVRVLGTDGGGDQHNLGYYVTQAALEEAHPTAEAGDWAIVGATDTVWIWDTDNSEWVDGDQKGQVTSVNGQTGVVVLSIPDAVQYSTIPTASADNLGDIMQFTGTTDANYTNGYFYKCVSDGQEPATYSWEAVEVQASSGGSSYTAGTGISIDANNEISVAAPTLQNVATSATELSICTYNNQRAQNVCIGGANKTEWYGYNGNVEILGTTSNNGGVAIGMQSSAKNIAIAIGRYAVAGAHYSIQIGQGTNSEEGTMCVGLYNGSSFVNYKLLDNYGTIPAARHATLPTADGTYVLKLVITDGTPTLQWVAE